MSTFNDSFSIELNHPLDKEAWNIIEDAELDSTEHIYFKTPNGKRVEFIKADVLNKIRADIEAKCCITVGRENDGAITLHDVFKIIDGYKAESEVEE